MRRRGMAVAIATSLAAGALQAGQTTVIPFAIPVGVPVTTVFRPQVFYAYRAYAPEKPPLTVERPAAGKRPAERSDAPRPAEPALQRCTRCHGGDAPKAGLDLSRPEALSERAKL